MAHPGTRARDLTPTGRIERPTPSEAWRAWLAATDQAEREWARMVFDDACRRASR